jgi:hypothetical protein
VIDRAVEDVREAVQRYTGGRGVAAVFDPIGASTYETRLQLLAPRGCLISYGELSGPAPAMNFQQLFAGSLFVTKYNGTVSLYCYSLRLRFLSPFKRPTPFRGGDDLFHALFADSPPRWLRSSGQHRLGLSLDDGPSLLLS